MGWPVVVGLGGTFVAVAFMFGWIAYAVLARQLPAQRRLHDAAAGNSASPGLAGPTTLTNRPTRAVERMSSFVPKSPKEMNRLRRRLMRAGYHGLMAAVVFSFAEIILPVTFFATTVAFLGWTTGTLLGLGSAAVGFLLPSVILGRLIETRRKAISNGLPDALDLLIVCLEAGCSLDQAIVKANEELTLSYPVLGEELKMLTTETRAGKPRIEAFKNLEARTKNDDVRSLVAMLVQTDRFGTSVSQALRTFAEVSRTKRRQRAEEKAAKVGVKLVFPLVLCLFPALFVATAGSAVVQIVRVFSELNR
jgi:tight adherence protein C